MVIQSGKEESTSLPLRHAIWRHTEFHRQVIFQIAGVKVLHCRYIQSGVSYIQGLLQFKYIPYGRIGVFQR